MKIPGYASLSFSFSFFKARNSRFLAASFPGGALALLRALFWVFLIRFFTAAYRSNSVRISGGLDDGSKIRTGLMSLSFGGGFGRFTLEEMGFLAFAAAIISDRVLKEM